MVTSVNSVVPVQVWESGIFLFLLALPGGNTLFVAADTKKQPREPHCNSPNRLFVFAALAEKVALDLKQINLKF